MSSIDFDILNTTICLIAKRNSGKSQLLRYIVMKNKHLFKKIFCICPTEKINKFYEDIIPKHNIFEVYSETWINILMQKLSVVNSGKKDKEAYHVLLILDDCCSDNDFHHSKSLKQIFTKGRHYYITIIITCQYAHHVPPVARINCDFICVGQLNSQGLEILVNEYLSGNMTKQEFIKMYYRCTNNFGFLLINNNSVNNNDDIDSIYGVLKTPEEFIKK